MKATRVRAPAYWSRYIVTAEDGTVLGVVEKRGQSSAWVVLGPDGRLVRTGLGSKRKALEELEPRP